ncbi:metal-dependent hydrolase [Janthinobacterium sp. 17J80-10]|uniref:metal-dependent hydrolase n=1 Tax=Janthinobacterium sp. 17J80-10 TaxID=2497863 RepID=UPI001005962E|nr:metal-dependent hydrolase [Janthinobacterium sp. 17J80-10]QAU35335.1 metal-dependent hydrolase [Janthinobacterium sp. 17J80-10]
MFIAHLPAGYISSAMLFPHFRFTGVYKKKFLASGVFGAIAPDLDIFYFYLIDHRQHNHHSYFSHFPLTWTVLLLCALFWLYRSRSNSMAALAAIFAFNGLVHMVLDTVVGSIQWLAPFIDRYFAAFPVPALYQPWWLNFILHWSFLLEIGILIFAIQLHRRQAN